jgi:predicted PurR-regulated permease PerM
MDNLKRPIYINITTLTVIKIILIFVLFYFLYLVREILAVLFISLILAAAVDPWIDWMQEKKIPRGVGILFIYLVMLTAISTVVYLIIPPIVEQVSELTTQFPELLEKIVSGMNFLRDYVSEHGILENIRDNIGSFEANFENAAGGVFSTVSGIVGGIVTFFLVLVITFYMVVEENAIKKIIWSIAPQKHQVYIMQLVNRMQKKVGLWLRGQLILSLIIFTLTYIGLSILGVEYALVLALIAGLTEFVPYLGPILAAIPAIFLSFTQAPMLAVFVAVLYYIIQLVENNIIVPKLMQKVVGLNPIVSIAVLLIGFKIAGVVGAVLSIPVATAVSVFVRDIFERNTGGGEV